MAKEVFRAIERFNAGRIRKYVELKYEKMSVSAFAFFRGTDHLFGEAWKKLQFSPVGPPVLSCGDLHLENFGAYRTADGDYRYDINDFDEAAVVPCDFDLIRFTASVLLAGEEWQLTPLQASRICLAYLDSYRQAISDGKPGEIGPGNGRGVVEDLLEKTARASPRVFLDLFTEKVNGNRQIKPDKEKRPIVSESEARAVREAFKAYGDQVKNKEAFKVQDVRGRVAGIGSLGVPRYVVLVKGDGNDRNRLLDVKSVLPSAIVGSSPSEQPTWKSQPDRVVDSQHRLQARPASLLAPLEIHGSPFRIREMVPEESRSGLDHFQEKPEKLRSAVETAARLTAWAHLRGSDPKDHPNLAAWSADRATDAILAAAMRIADLTVRQHDEFCGAL